MGDPKPNKKGKMVEGKKFALYHCWGELKNDEKWRNRDGLEVPIKLRKAIKETVDGVIGVEDSSSSEETPNSVAKTTRARPPGKKQAKLAKSKSGDEDFNKAMAALVQARKDAAEERRLKQEKEAEAEKRKVAAEERRAAVDKRRLALEEKRAAAEEHQRLIEQEKNLFLMDTSNLDDRQKEYVNLMRDQILAQKRMSAMGGTGGYG